MGDNGFNWQCPYCNRHATIVPSRLSCDAHVIDLPSKQGLMVLRSLAIVCPNEQCKELVVTAYLVGGRRVPNGTVADDAQRERITQFKLRPAGKGRPLPSYIPKPIADDYREACVIADLSPKASATLARRCLQGMIRDFHGVVRDNLFKEIAALEEKIDGDTWDAIDAVRKIGNVGAHMEKDIDVIVDVDPKEAELLIGLIENLIDDWYVARYDRQERKKKIVAAAQAKDEAKKQAPESA